MVHPFHPLNGKQFVCVGQRHSRYGSWLLLQVDDDEVRAVPPQWTDVVAPDPERALSAGCCYFRVGDLMALAELVERLRHAGSSPKTSDDV